MRMHFPNYPADSVVTDNQMMRRQLPVHTLTISPSDSWASSWSVEELKSSQAAHTALNQMITWLSSKSVPYCVPKGSSIQLQSLWTQRRYLLLKDGILYRRWEDVPGKGLHKRLQLVLPHQLVVLPNTCTRTRVEILNQGQLKRSAHFWISRRPEPALTIFSLME